MTPLREIDAISSIRTPARSHWATAFAASPYPIREPRKRAVVVGITYRGLSLQPLLGCERDAISFSKILVSEFGFKDSDILLMT
ncbi:hypothetical protein CBR_g78104, partial [Chara braunii]